MWVVGLWEALWYGDEMKRWAYLFEGENRIATINKLGVEARTIEEAAAAIRLRHGAGEIVSIHGRFRYAHSSKS